LPWQPKEKTLEKYFKIFSSKTTGHILVKIYQRHPCGGEHKRYRTKPLISSLFLVDMATKIKIFKNTLNILVQNYWPDSFKTLEEASVLYRDSNIPRTHPYINKEQKKSDKLHDISLFVI